ncbi:MAG: YlxR family protein [Anaerosomatales bacterium]|nr:YlxR family protein [Anaerosomatales bacterium]MDT8433380.1 YlxR family protein [Anaerosomatales bacterium]
MTRTRKTPTRTCVGCGRTDEKCGLVRIVRTTDAHIELDPTGKTNGRGAYVCPSVECFDAAAGRRRFDSALRVHLHDDDLDRLRRDLETLLTSAAPSQQGR